MINPLSKDNLEIDQEFNLGYWLFLHRELFKKILTGALIIVAVAFLAYSSIKWIGYLASTKAYNEMLFSLTNSEINYQSWHEKNKPLAIEIIGVVAVPMGQTYDLVAQIKNPNLQWAISSFDYNFQVNGQTKARGNSFILPLEEKFVFVRNVVLENSLANFSLSLDNINWYRIKDLKNFPLPNFISAKQKIEDLYTLTEGQANGTRLTFDLTNNSPYSFWDVRVVSLLLSGNQVRAVGVKEIRSVDANETVQLKFDWPEAMSGLTNAIIKPEVNVLDAGVLKLP